MRAREKKNNKNPKTYTLSLSVCRPRATQGKRDETLRFCRGLRHLSFNNTRKTRRNAAFLSRAMETWCFWSDSHNTTQTQTNSNGFVAKQDQKMVI